MELSLLLKAAFLEQRHLAVLTSQGVDFGQNLGQGFGLGGEDFFRADDIKVAAPFEYLLCFRLEFAEIQV